MIAIEVRAFDCTITIVQYCNPLTRAATITKNALQSLYFFNGNFIKKFFIFCFAVPKKEVREFHGDLPIDWVNARREI